VPRICRDGLPVSKIASRMRWITSGGLIDQRFHKRFHQITSMKFVSIDGVAFVMTHLRTGPRQAARQGLYTCVR
jgi:hypothetical protein